MCQSVPRSPVKEYSCIRVILIIRKYLVSPIFWNIIFSSSISRALTAGRPRSVNICAVCNLSQICTVFTRKEQCRLNITILHIDHRMLLYLQIILPTILIEQSEEILFLRWLQRVHRIGMMLQYRMDSWTREFFCRDDNFQACRLGQKGWIYFTD